MKLQDIKIHVNTSTCIGCGLCVKDCPSKVLVMENGKAMLTSDTCLKCAHCFAICPSSSIMFEGTNDSVINFDDNSFIPSEQLLTHLKLRRTIRHFKKEKPSRGQLEQIIEAGRLTPTASNKQNVRYIVIDKDVEHLEDLGIAEYTLMQKSAKEGKIKIPPSLLDATFNRGFLFQNAPSLILVISSHEQNASLASSNMELMCSSLGLGSVYVGLFTRPANTSATIREYLGIKDNEKIVTCLAIGYPEIHYVRSAPKLPADITWNIR